MNEDKETETRKEKVDKVKVLINRNSMLEMIKVASLVPMLLLTLFFNSDLIDLFALGVTCYFIITIAGKQNRNTNVIDKTLNELV
jgi:hypothetical protein